MRDDIFGKFIVFISKICVDISVQLGVGNGAHCGAHRERLPLPRITIGVAKGNRTEIFEMSTLILMLIMKMIMFESRRVVSN